MGRGKNSFYPIELPVFKAFLVSWYLNTIVQDACVCYVRCYGQYLFNTLQGPFKPASVGREEKSGLLFWLTAGQSPICSLPGYVLYGWVLLSFRQSYCTPRLLTLNVCPILATFFPGSATFVFIFSMSTDDLSRKCITLQDLLLYISSTAVAESGHYNTITCCNT